MVELAEVNRSYPAWDYTSFTEEDYYTLGNVYDFTLCRITISPYHIRVFQLFIPSGKGSIPYFSVTEGKRTKRGRGYKEAEIVFTKSSLSKLTGIPVNKLHYHHLSRNRVIAIPYTLHRDPHKEGEKEFNRKVLNYYVSILKGKKRKLLKSIE
jgi:hypothetical protein